MIGSPALIGEVVALVGIQVLEAIIVIQQYGKIIKSTQMCDRQDRATY